jgi:hypothetical protein
MPEYMTDSNGMAYDPDTVTVKIPRLLATRFVAGRARPRAHDVSAQHELTALVRNALDSEDES